MRGSALLDLLLDAVWSLRAVSGAQWTLRGVAAAATAVALLLALPSGPGTGAGPTLATTVVAAALALQVLRPDHVLGVLAPAAVVVSVAARGGLPLPVLAGVGLCLLISHAAFALAAAFPAHGVLDRSGWALSARRLLAVLALALLAGALVLALTTVRLGPWAAVLGVLGAIALLVVLLPRSL